jgi:hypothetical protein
MMAVLAKKLADDLADDAPQAPVRRETRVSASLRHPIAHAALAVKIAAAVLAPLVASLAVLAGIGSFATIRHQATPWFGDAAWIVPVGIDIGIIALLAWDLLAEYLRFPWPVLRWTAWLFVGMTVFLNISAAHGHLSAIVMHAAMPMLVVVVVEGIRHLLRQWTGLAAGTRIERIPASRWLMSPWASFMLARRMVLWQVTSYRYGLALEYQRLQTIAQLQETYGRHLWRWKAPLRDRLTLRLAWAGSATDADDIEAPAAAAILDPVAYEVAHVTPGESAEPRDTVSRLLGHLPRHCMVPVPEVPKLPDEPDRVLIDAAAEILQDAARQGIRLSQVALAKKLRERGHRVANERLRGLVATVQRTPMSGEAS